MRLPSALAALLAFYQRHGHSIWALAEEDHHEQHERKLLLNQAEAARRVDEVVKDAMVSADAGDVKGVALSLSYVKLSEAEGGTSPPGGRALSLPRRPTRVPAPLAADGGVAPTRSGEGSARYG